MSPVKSGNVGEIPTAARLTRRPMALTWGKLRDLMCPRLGCQGTGPRRSTANVSLHPPSTAHLARGTRCAYVPGMAPTTIRLHPCVFP